jgi:hypothetical protein
VERGPDAAVLAVSFVPRDTHHFTASSSMMGIARSNLA